MSTLFRKVTASVAALSIVLSVVSPVTGVRAATDSAVDAANRLAADGIIADQSKNPTAYNLGSSITRREMLKVMMNLSSTEVSNTCEGKFADLKASDWGCKYAEAALKAGFIAANKNFRPNDLVSKSEALKMIMQAKGIAKKDGVEPWQKAYVEAAVEAGVLSAAFTDYTATAKRSMVVVAADAAQSASSDEGDDDLDIGDLIGGVDTGSTNGTGTTNTTTGTTSTGTTNVDTNVKSGSLEVTLNPSSPANGTLVPKAGLVRFASVDFAAGKSDVSVNTVKVAKQGLNSISGVSKVWFEKNGTRVSSQASFSSEGDATISFAPAYVVKAGSTETLDLYVELDASVGSDYQFKSVEISTSAADFKGSFVTSTLRTADYTVAGATIANQGSGNIYNASNEKVELGKFTVQNTDTSSETRDQKFQTVMFYQSGSANLTNLSNITVERNGVVVSTAAVISGKTLTVTLADTIKDGVTATYTIKANINVVEDSQDTYQFYVKKGTDVNVIELNNGFRSTVTGTPVLALFTVKGGDVTFANDSAIAKSSNVAPGSSDVVLAKGTITAKSAVNLEDVSVTFSTTNANLKDVANTIYLQIGNSTFSVNPSTATGVTTLKFDGSVTVNGTAQVKMYTKLKDNSAGAKIKASDISLTSFTTKEYASNQNTVSSFVGVISGITVNVDTTGLNVTRVDGLGDTKLAVGAKNQTIYAAKYSVSQGNAVSVSNFKATFSGSALSTAGANATVSMYVDGVVKATKSVTANGTVSFDGLNATVSTSKAVTVELKADFNDVITTGIFLVHSADVDATDSLTSANITETNVKGPLFTVAKAVGTLASTDLAPKATLILAGTKDVVLSAVKVTATNDSIKLTDLVATGAKLSNLSNFRLLDSNKALVATATVADDTNVKFENIASNNAIAQDKSGTFYVVADANSATDVTGVVLTVATVNSNITATNGEEIPMAGSVVTSNSHAIAQNTAVVAKATNSSKDLSTSALRFTVTASGKDVVTISGATLDISTASYATGAKVKIYKNTVTDSNLVYAATAYSTDASGNFKADVSFTGNKTVDAGSTATYIVVVDALATDLSKAAWTVKLTNVDFGAFQANQYDNVGQFAITESK